MRNDSRVVLEHDLVAARGELHCGEPVVRAQELALLAVEARLPGRGRTPAPRPASPAWRSWPRNASGAALRSGSRARTAPRAFPPLRCPLQDHLLERLEGGRGDQLEGLLVGRGGERAADDPGPARRARVAVELLVADRAHELELALAVPQVDHRELRRGCRSPSQGVRTTRGRVPRLASGVVDLERQLATLRVRHGLEAHDELGAAAARDSRGRTGSVAQSSLLADHGSRPCRRRSAGQAITLAMAPEFSTNWTATPSSPSRLASSSKRSVSSRMACGHGTRLR